jgi:uncharacterized coiled-coil protein SlyX
MRTELASTKAELEAQQAAQEEALEAERSARLEMAAATDSLRINVGGMQQQLAATSSELAKERDQAANMKERLNKLNSAYSGTSEPPPPLRSAQCRIQPGRWPQLAHGVGDWSLNAMPSFVLPPCRR